MKYSNQFNNQALRKFTALDLDLLMAIASRVRDKGTDEVAFTFEGWWLPERPLCCDDPFVAVSGA